MRALTRSLEATVAWFHDDFYINSFEAVRTDVEARNVSITTWSTFSGNVTAKNAVRINALGAIDLGNQGIKAGGRVSVKGNEITGNIKTDGSTTNPSADIPNIEVRSWNSYGGDISGPLNVTVSVAKDFMGSIKAGGDLNVFAGRDIDIIGGFTGGVHNGETETSFAPQNVVAYGSLRGDFITAQTNLNVMGFGKVDVDKISVTANGLPGKQVYDLSVTTEGELTADLTSEGDIRAYGYAGFTGKVAAKDDVAIVSYGNITSSSFAITEVSPPPVLTPEELAELEPDEIDARAHNVRITASGAVNLASGVTAPDNVQIDAHGDVTGDVTTTRGLVFVTAGVKRSPGSEPGGTPQYTSTKYTGAIAAGGAVTVATSGSIDAKVVSGKSISLASSTGDIKATSVTATDGGVSISSGGKINVGTNSSSSGGGAKIQASGDSSTVTLNAVDLVEATIHSGQGITITSGASVSVTATSDSGGIEIAALGDITDGTFNGKLDVDVTSYGTISHLDSTSTTGETNAFADTKMTDVKLKGDKGASASSLGDVGTIDFKSANGPVSVLALSVTNGKIEASGNVDVVVKTSVKADTVKSTGGDVNIVAANGFIKTDVTAKHDVNLAALGDNSQAKYQFPSPPSFADEDSANPWAPTPPTSAGGIIGNITATEGDVSISSSDGVMGTIKASGGSVEISAIGDVQGPTVTAYQDVDVSSFGSVKSVSTNAQHGNATINAGVSISGTVHAFVDATANALTGTVGKTVTANTGNASVYAGQDILENISAGKNANAYALGKVAKNVTAGIDAEVTSAGGILSGTITAGQDVFAFSLETSSGTISAGRDATVTTLGNRSGTITAGRNADVTAAGNSTSAVTAGEDVNLFAFGPVSGIIIATNGSADVSTYGLLTSNITAGIDISVFAYGGSTGTTTAGQDLYLTSLGVTGGTYSAPRDVVVFASQALTGTLNAGRDAVAIGLSTVQIPVTAGRDAFVFSGGAQQGAVSADRDAVLVVLGTSSGSTVTAGESALLYVVGSVTTAQVIGQNAALISWDLVGGPSLVQGVDSAFAFSYGNFTGTVSASEGDAGLVTYGNAYASVTGALSAVSLTVGTFDGSVTGGEFAGAISLTDFFGEIDSGGDAVLLTEGDATAEITALDDAFIWSLGDFTGTIEADRDVGAVTYGDLDAEIFAGRDILGVASVGSISGSLVANRNIGNLMTYGEMAANVEALNTLNETGAGQVGNVTAWGPITGNITAPTSIGLVASADDITGLITAPSVLGILDFHAAVLTDNPLPETPESIKTDVVTDGAAALASVLADKAQFATDRTDFLGDMAEDKDDTADDIAQSRSDVAAQNATDLIDNQDDLNEDKSATLIVFASDREDVEDDYQELVDTAATDQTEFEEAVALSVAANTASWNASAEDADDDVAEGIASKEESEQQRTGALEQEATRVEQEKTAARNQRSALAQAAAEVFSLEAIGGVLGGAAIFGLLPSPIALPVMLATFGTNFYLAGEEQVGAMLDEQGVTGWNRAYQVMGAGVWSHPILKSGFQLVYGIDPLTGEQLTSEYLIEHSLIQLYKGGLEALRDALIFKGVRLVTSPCGGMFSECFVGETRVLKKEISVGVSQATVSVESTSTESDLNEVVALICIAIGAGGMLLIHRRDQRLRAGMHPTARLRLAYASTRGPDSQDRQKISV